MMARPAIGLLALPLLVVSASPDVVVAQPASPRPAIRSGDWVVPIGCNAMYLQGREECRAVNVYKVLVNLRGDRAPKAILYAEPARDTEGRAGLRIFLATDRDRRDVQTIEPTAAAGPFRSREVAEAWAKAIEGRLGENLSPALPERVVSYIGQLDPETKRPSAILKVVGVVAETAYGNRGGEFSVRTDAGVTITFAVTYQDLKTKIPSQQQVGKRIEVEYREITILRGKTEVRKQIELVGVRLP